MTAGGGAVRDIGETAVIAAVERAAAAAGAEVYAHAIDIDSGIQVGLGADAPVVTASVFKVPVLTEYVRQVAAGELDPRARIVVRAAASTPGPTGLSVFADDAEWSLRDLVTSMITVSDNAATDIVCRLVGLDRVNATMVQLGLTETRLIGDVGALFDALRADYGLPPGAPLNQIDEHAHPERIPGLAVCTPARTNRSTPRESTRLLELLWTDRAAPADACAQARVILGRQVWPHRLTSGFPEDTIRVSGKTGTMFIVRNEIGVVEFADGRRFAVAVFVRAKTYSERNQPVDRLIGTVGRLLVDHCSSVHDTQPEMARQGTQG